LSIPTTQITGGFVLKSGRARRAIGFAVIAGIIVVLVILPSVLKPSHYLRWGVEVGDQFTYRVLVDGYLRVEDPENDSNIIYQPAFFAPMNNTVIAATISRLPTLAAWFDESSFVSEIVNQVKVNCTFENGTSIQEEVQSEVATIVSHCVLPVGNWPFLDSLFPDSGDNPGYPTVMYLTKACPECFSMSHRTWAIDGQFSWTGNVSLTTGMPTVAEDVAYTPSTGYYHLIRLILLQWS